MSPPNRRAALVSGLAVLLLSGSLALAAPPAAAPHVVPPKVQAVAEHGAMLAAIDTAFLAGDLTYPEAGALYAEQAAIRADWIKSRLRFSADLAARRALFMIRTAQGTYARLKYNAERRVEVAFGTF